MSHKLYRHPNRICKNEKLFYVLPSSGGCTSNVSSFNRNLLCFVGLHYHQQEPNTNITLSCWSSFTILKYSVICIICIVSFWPTDFHNIPNCHTYWVQKGKIFIEDFIKFNCFKTEDYKILQTTFFSNIQFTFQHSYTSY